MSNEVTTKEYWENYWGKDNVKYPNYDITTGMFYSLKLLLDKHIRETRARLGNKNLRVLDCGCGEGLILRFLAEQFEDLEIWGIEYAETYKKAVDMAEELGHSINVINGDLLKEWDPEHMENFDIIISVGLIEHFKDPGDILAQMKLALVKGGCFITIIPNFDGIFNLLWKSYDRQNYSYHIPIKKNDLIELHENLLLENVSFYRLGTPLIPGLHNVHTRWQKFLQLLIVNINGRILQKIFPRQKSLEKSYPSTPTSACAGYKI